MKTPSRQSLTPSDAALASELASEVADCADDARTALVARVEAADDPGAVLSDLLRSRDATVRGWVGQLALDVLGPDAMPLLLRLFRDRDPDNRSDAIGWIGCIDPTYSSILPALRRRMGARTDHEAAVVGWALVKLRDTASIPLIEQYVAEFEAYPDWWQPKVASVQAMALRDPASVSRAIRDHDHRRMRWLAFAAAILGGSEVEALHWGAAELADEECRAACRTVLEHYLPEFAADHQPAH